LEIIFMMAMVFQTSSILERKFRQLALRMALSTSNGGEAAATFLVRTDR
jgi:hypothetical protein